MDAFSKFYTSTTFYYIVELDYTRIIIDLATHSSYSPMRSIKSPPNRKTNRWDKAYFHLKNV